MRKTMQDDLSQKHCVPCEGGVPPLTEKEYDPLLKKINGWTVTDGKKLDKEFKKKDFKEALNFINKNGLSENDFILAHKIDQI